MALLDLALEAEPDNRDALELLALLEERLQLGESLPIAYSNGFLR